MEMTLAQFKQRHHLLVEPAREQHRAEDTQQIVALEVGRRQHFDIEIALVIDSRYVLQVCHVIAVVVELFYRKRCYAFLFLGSSVVPCFRPTNLTWRLSAEGEQDATKEHRARRV